MRLLETLINISDKDLTKSVIYTQLLLLLFSVGLSFFFFSNMKDWLQYFRWDLQEIFYYGVLPGMIIVSMNIFLMNFFPKESYDDGGINERIFKNKSLQYILLIVILVSVSEELLFRGVIQSTFGYVFASALFALIHFRYLRKPLLLISVILTSFYIGYLFKVTENLNVTIVTHFIVNFILGLIIR